MPIPPVITPHPFDTSAVTAIEYANCTAEIEAQVQKANPTVFWISKKTRRLQKALMRTRLEAFCANGDLLNLGDGDKLTITILGRKYQLFGRYDGRFHYGAFGVRTAIHRRTNLMRTVNSWFF